MRTNRIFSTLASIMAAGVFLVACSGSDSASSGQRPDDKSGFNAPADGKVLKFVFNHGTGAVQPVVARALQVQWQEVLGAEMQPEGMEYAQLVNGLYPKHDFVSGWNGWIADYPGVYNFLGLHLPGNVNNAENFNNPRYIELVAQGFAAPDVATANGFYSEAEAELLKSGLIVPLFQGTSAHLKKPYVTGIYANNGDVHPLRHVRLDKSWKPNEGTTFFGKVDPPKELTFRMCAGSKISTLDPGHQLESWGVLYGDALFEGLGNNDPMTGTVAEDSRQLLPGMAEKIEVSPDGKTYAFTLRTDSSWVKVVDGKVKKVRSVNASDFAFAWQRCLDKVNGCEYGPMMIDDLGIQSVETTGANTFIVHLKQASSLFPTLLAFPILQPVPADLVKQFGDSWVLPENIISNGAYVLESQSQTELRLVKNPFYWWWKVSSDADKAPDLIIATISSNSQAIQDSFASGQLDWMGLGSRPVPEMIAENKGRAADLEVVMTYSSYWIVLNPDPARGPFADPRVGQALGYAIDREAIVASLKLPDHPVGTFVPVGLNGYKPKDGVGYTYDPAKARKLLSEAGYSVPSGQGE